MSQDYHDQPVRSFIHTGGRSEASRNGIRPETLVHATRGGPPLPVSATRAEHALLATCRRLLSVAEAAVALDLPVSVALVMASDLVDSGHLTVRTPAVPSVSYHILEELLNGLRKLV
jgi:hypothetical protein